MMRTILAAMGVIGVVIGAGCGDDIGASTTPSGRSFGPLDLVTPDPHRGLVIEVDWVEGRRPGDGAAGRVQELLDDLIEGGHLGKPDGARIVFDDAVPGADDPDKTYTFAELDAKVTAHRDVEPAEGEAGVYVLFADGRYEGDAERSAVLGFAYGGSAIVMLADNIERACDGSLPLFRERLCELTTATVWVHELGHVFGLVNNGLPMVEPHQDVDHGKHDTNEDCVMHHRVHGTTAAQRMLERLDRGEESVLPFDQACLDDLRAAQP